MAHLKQTQTLSAETLSADVPQLIARPLPLRGIVVCRVKKMNHWFAPVLFLAYCLSTTRPLTAQEAAQIELPDETVGLDNIAKALISTFDQVDVLALADTHQRKIDSDLRLGIVRNPEFAQKAHFILVEFANTADQPILDRYISGEDVPPSELRQVWKKRNNQAVLLKD